MNRDESKSRAPERPPRIERSETGISRAAPIDGEAGGTWIGVNDRGLGACILNGYGEQHVPASDYEALHSGRRLSRGTIIPAALDRGSASDALRWLNDTFDPSPYASFRLILCGPGRAESLEWDGRGEWRRESLAGEWILVISSGWRRDEVAAWRRSRFDEWLNHGAPFRGPLPAFHLDQAPGRESWSPIMERPESSTRSVTQIEVGDAIEQAVLRYWGSPDAARAGESPRTELELPLKNAPGP